MKASELIKKLVDAMEGHGDLEVRGYFDHGQTSVRVDSVVEGYIEEDTYMAESIHPDDLEEYPEAIKIIEING